MAYGLAIQRQDSFGGGIYRGRRAPADSLYDALNALVSDEREVFERRGSSMKSTADAPDDLVAIADSLLPPGQRTLVWTPAETLVLGADDATLTMLQVPGTMGPPVGRAVPGPGCLAWVISSPSTSFGLLVLYFGTQHDFYVTAPGTVTVTNGSKTVTGVGTTFMTKVSPGGVLDSGPTTAPGVVDMVLSDTQLMLREPWAGVTDTTGGTISPFWRNVPQVPGVGRVGSSLALASAGTRLIYCVNERAYLSLPGQPTAFDPSTYHELPSGSRILGAVGAGATAALLTTDGMWTIANMDLDVFDAAGNVQQQVQQVNKDLILWGDKGIASWAGSVLVPALDDVFVVGLDGSASPVSESIRQMYRDYVQAGYAPGIAAVHRGHYFLPIVDPAGVLVDELVCRLDLSGSRGSRRPAWTRWAGHAAGVGCAQRVGGTDPEPKLLGVKGPRITDLTGCFQVQGAGADADGSVPTFDVVTNDLATGGGARGATCRKLRLRYELAGAGSSVSAAVSRGAEGAAFDALTVPGDGGVSDGSTPATWLVNRRSPALRFRIRSTSANTKLIVRGVEMHLRPTGKA